MTAKKLFPTLALFIVGILLYNNNQVLAQAPSFVWANQAAGPSYDYGNAIAVDDNSNTYVTGSYAGSVTFGTTSLINSNSLTMDMFLAKYNEAGIIQWAVNSGGTEVEGYGIAVDNIGNCYVVGSFEASVTFGNTTLYSSGLSDLFLVKFNSNGEPQWAVSGGGTNYDAGIGVTVDESRNIFVTGSYRGTGIFGTTILTGDGNSSPMIIKYDSTGNVLWASKGGGSGTAGGQSIAIDNHGNSYVHGFFNGILTFDSITFSGHTFYWDVFTVKFDSDGNLQWANQAGGNDSDEGRGIAVDGSGNCYVTGSFTGTANFGNTTLTASLYTAYVAKYDTDGNLQWAKKNEGPGSAGGFRIGIDQNDNVYIGGSFHQSIAFGNSILNSNGVSDIFIAKYSAAGIPQWALSGGGTGHEVCFGLTVHKSGDCYLTGYIRNTASFGNTTITSLGETDIFVAKVSESITATHPNIDQFEFITYPNPFASSFHLSLPTTNQAEVLLTDMLGREVYRQKVIADAGSKTLEITPAATLLPGMYLLRLQQGLEVRHSRIIKQ